MPAHRIKKVAGTEACINGSAGMTAGLSFDTNGACSTRTASTAAPKFSTDASTIQNLVDGTWGNKGAVTAMTSGSATALFDVSVPSGLMSGGQIQFLVEAFDGTDYQADAGLVTYSAVNKAGTVTTGITYVAANEAKTVSAGTLTQAWTFVAGTLKATVKVAITTSLTSTLLRITYLVVPVRGTVTPV